MRIDHELTTLILCALYLLDVSPGSIVLHCLWHYKASKGQGCWLLLAPSFEDSLTGFHLATTQLQ